MLTTVDQRVLTIGVGTEAAEKLKAFGADMEKVANYSAGLVSKDMAKFIKNKFLNGQALNKVTGKTANSMQGYWSNGSWYVRYGFKRGGKSLIKGSLNYLNRWLGTPHEFMSPGADTYLGSGKADKVVKKNLTKMVKKMEGKDA